MAAAARGDLAGAIREVDDNLRTVHDTYSGLAARAQLD